jgi:diaminopimelate decarboxylase
MFSPPRPRVANDNDPDGDPISIVAIGDPSHGTVKLLSGGSVLYVPRANFHGTDSFSYRIADDKHGKTCGAVTVTVTPQPVIELGRYLVGEAGLYVCEVVDRKISRGQVFLVCNGGLHHHLAASGNFGQVIRKNYPVVVGTRVRGNQREVVNVVGPLCTPLDVLAQQMELARADVGDLVVVFQSGAYGYTASPTRFLSHPEPVEVLV